MFQPEKVKGIIFDYGGTLDSNGLHWAEVIWSAYREAAVPVAYARFRDAYVHGERTLGRTPVIQPHHNFRDMLLFKIRLQLNWLVENGYLDAAYAAPPAPSGIKAEAKATTDTDAPATPIAYAKTNAAPATKTAISTESKTDADAQTDAPIPTDTALRLADHCYAFARQSIENARPLLDRLRARYPLVLVSNFYGNIETVLNDFRLDTYFGAIIESAVVGIRKPDPAIFRLGIEKLGFAAPETVVIGDSFDKDILPASSLGCQTIWLKNIGWTPYTGAETADAVVSDFREIGHLFSTNAQ